jgi:phosphoribosylamine--glycine ligase
MTHILIIGSGARECMIIKKLLHDSEYSVKITCIGSTKNPYINKHAKLYISDLNTLNIKNLVSIIGTPDYAIIGPENPLKLGISNLLESLNIPCIGPLQLYSQIETSKIFARRFIDEIGCGKYSPHYIIVKTGEKIVDLLKDTTIKNLVIKKDGLHGGKGVLVQGIDFNTINEIEDELKNIDENILIEEKLEGEEFSLMSITDGRGNVAHFPPIKDYKRLNDGDIGPNTGSMGCIIDTDNTLPFLDECDVELGETINTKVINKLNELGKKNECKIGYRGILYGSYIKTKDGKIYIIEFNSRFGDPEGIIALNLLKSNFFNICNKMVNGSLTNDMHFSNKAMIGIYLVPKTYPNKSYDKHDIYITDHANKNNLIYGNVEEHDNHFYSLSSRSLFYFIEAEDLGICYTKIYNEIKNIIGYFHYRTDIGQKYINS